ncbi:sensor histidine kinase [Sphingomonas sp.]|jgi:signal transduction histidine kinase|uniref:sensor histidine kinase n=1 Tax=Sphingomonas sp. TaxID=28214 RepID=UPI002D80807C|nr:ATP-binding protein [Sphingomonas sp.]HEU0044590.1 ATP-binding protein [Sphingomonas sp.]
MAALIAVALFVAQAINLGFALRDRREFRLAQATRPVATRIADALEREAQGARAILPDRGRVRRVPTNPLPGAAIERRPEVATELRRQLGEVDVPVGRIEAGVVPRPFTRREADRGPGEMLLIAVEQPGRGWLTVIVPWGSGGGRLLIVLLLQTIILYIVVLLPVLWIARRISRPLRGLTAAAGAFDPATPPAPLTEQGPDDLRQLIAAFNALRLRVTAMLDEKDRMLGAIGHDLRTPLAALRVRIESVEDDHDRARMADTVAEMSRTLDDILSLARIGRPSEPPVEVDLAALVDAVVEDFRDLDQDVVFEDSERLPLRLRPGLMRRAVRNLIENAVKYGGGAQVSLVADARHAAILVRDNGPGIPPDQLAAVLEPFTRLETSRNRCTGGVGLGLALARSIVSAAGGSLHLANRAEGGLSAEIRLPR